MRRYNLMRRKSAKVAPHPISRIGSHVFIFALAAVWICLATPVMAENVVIGTYGGGTIASVGSGGDLGVPFTGSGTASFSQSPSTVEQYGNVMTYTASANIAYSITNTGTSADIRLQGNLAIASDQVYGVSGSSGQFGGGGAQGPVIFTVTAPTTFTLSGSSNYTDGAETLSVLDGNISNASGASSITNVSGIGLSYHYVSLGFAGLGISGIESKDLESRTSSNTIFATGVLAPGTYNYTASYGISNGYSDEFGLPRALNGSDSSGFIDLTLVTAPEPSTLSLIGIAVSAALLRRRASR